MTFIFVLWSVGGALDFELGGTQFHIPGFLVIAAFLYAMFGTGSMLIIGRASCGSPKSRTSAKPNSAMR